MDKFTKDEIRESLMYLKQGEISITETLNDIVEIVNKHFLKLRKRRNNKNKSIIQRNNT